MRLRGALRLLVALGASSCACSSPPEPGRAAVEAPRGPGLTGRVAIEAPGAGDARPAVEVLIVPEATMIDHVTARLGEARAALARSARARERARQEARVALAEADSTSQAWKAANDNDLYRRVEVLLRRPRDPGEVNALHQELFARKKAAYARATRAARRSDDLERAFDELQREVRHFREAGYFAQGLSSVVPPIRTDASGSFVAPLAPGRYALVALTERVPADSVATPGWLLWTEVREGGPTPIRLDESNQHGTNCDACVVPAKELP